MNSTSESQIPRSPVDAPSGAESILVVDDHPELCEVASILLRRCGYRVFTAHDGRQAKQIARENPDVDLLLTDIEMPDMLGDELAEWFRITRPRTAVVFMSGNPMQHRRLGTCPFIEKPFIHLDTLVNTIRGVLNQRHLTQQTVSAAA